MLIAASGQQVARGLRLVTDTGQTLGGVVDKVASIDALIGEIAQSSQEQAIRLQQVNTAVNQMDQVTQQSAGMGEEVTAAASNFKLEARDLAALVGRFEIAQPQVRSLASARRHLAA